MQSDIMIVKMSENDYYVSTKLHDKEPYYKLLVNRSRISKHYCSLDEARLAAAKMKDSIICSSPSCQIIEIDFNCYPKNLKPKKIPVAFEYDDENQALFGITEKGKRVFEMGQDVPFLYIDVIEYRNRLDNQSNAEDSDIVPYFRKLGKARAYELAYNCGLPYLRYEIYKAKKLLKIFEYDVELHQFDMEFYLGYIDGLYEAIAILKNSVLQPRNDWKVHVFDLTQKYDFEITPNDSNAALGEYIIELHGLLDDCIGANNPNDIYVFFAEKATAQYELLSSLQISDKQLVVFDKEKILKPINNQRIEKLVVKLFKLGKGDDDLKIDEKWLQYQNAQ